MRLTARSSQELGGMKRVMHVISGDLWAGAEVQAYQAIKGLLDRFELQIAVVVFNEGILADKLRSLGVKVYCVDEKRFNSFSILTMMTRIFAQFKPQVVHVHHTKEHFLSTLVRFAHNSGFLIVRTMHGRSKAPEGLDMVRHCRSSAVVSLDTILLRYFANTIIAVSEDLASDLSAMKCNGKVSLIYNGLDVSGCLKEAERVDNPRIGFDKGNLFWVGTAARLVPVKNLEMLIDAAEILKLRGLPVHVSIWGDGPTMPELRSRIAQKGLAEHVTLHGFESGILSIIKSLDAFVLCSHHEGLPMALLEAMCLRTPVICTRVGGMKEVIRNGINGYSITPNDSFGLADAIERLYRNPGRAEQVASSAYRTLEEKFSLATSTDSLFRIYVDSCRG